MPSVESRVHQLVQKTKKTIAMKYNSEEFDDMRPYTDAEIPAAMKRIAESQSLPLLASYIYPNENCEEVRKKIAAYKTIKSFQTETMSVVNEQIIANTTDGFSCNGISHLSPKEQYLYVSNHRDIMLDASLLQYHLFTQGFETTEITFGANLMQGQLVIDIGKSNKMFRVERPGGSIRDFYKKSLHLSRYIRYCIGQKHESVWIAQRNGRTKDGMDRTDQGIIKMFCMSEPEDKIRAIADLHIVPVAVSYEWEPCDVLKTLELYESQFTKYTKKPGEDLNSILTGILQRKGHVHFELCEPLTDVELHAFDGLTNNEYHRAVSHLIDRRIVNAYRLFPNNYIAYDLRYGTQQYGDMYTEEEKEQFLKHLNILEKYDTCDIDRLKDILLGIYSNPILNKITIDE